MSLREAIFDMQSQIQEFIIKARAGKATDEQIVKILLEQGWSLKQIQANMASTPTLNGLIPPKPTEVAASTLGMWDAFQHILLFISLYVMATSIALILHYFVDNWFPINNGYNSSLSLYEGTPAVFSMYSAGLLVSFPFFAYFFLETARRKKKVPEIINMHSRKVLIYLTLVITFIIMVTHLIIVVYSVLSGNVTINSLLHFLVTLLVTGTIFAYYLYEIRHDRKIN